MEAGRGLGAACGAMGKIMNKLKTIIYLLFSKGYVVITVGKHSGEVNIKSVNLSDSFFMATVLSVAYDRFLELVVDQSAEAGAAKAAQDLLKALNKVETTEWPAPKMDQ